jgi:hypothetical protein
MFPRSALTKRHARPSHVAAAPVSAARGTGHNLDVDARARRLAENEALFRAANERIERTATTTAEPGDLVPFLCECPEGDCRGTIALTMAEYERVRSDSTLFVVLPGHERPSIEDVVERYERYMVVRKKGPAAEVADDLNPRS